MGALTPPGYRDRTLGVVSRPSQPADAHDSPAPDGTPVQDASLPASRTTPGPGRRARLPHAARVLGVWAAATAVSFLVLRLGAADTPATVWAPAAPSWSEHISFWDAGWYDRIHREGYPTVLPTNERGTVLQNSWAFMPLLPSLAGPLTWTGWSFYACAALVATAASAGAALVTDRWLAPRTGRAVSLWAVGLAWSSPCAVVLQLPYAESLGLLLGGAALMLAARREFLLALPVVVLAAFARPIGVPLTAALGMWWLCEVARASGHLPASTVARLLPGEAALVPGERLRLAVLTLAAAASALAWPALAWSATGRIDAYTATETAWRNGSLAPFLPWLTRSQWWVGDHLGWLLLLAVLAVAALGLSAPSLRRLGAAAWFWCVGYVAYLLVFFDPTTSVFRILLPLVPVAWALAASAGTTRRRLALLACCGAGQLVWVSWLWNLGSVSITWVP